MQTDKTVPRKWGRQLVTFPSNVWIALCIFTGFAMAKSFDTFISPNYHGTSAVTEVSEWKKKGYRCGWVLTSQIMYRYTIFMAQQVRCCAFGNSNSKQIETKKYCHSSFFLLTIYIPWRQRWRIDFLFYPRALILALLPQKDCRWRSFWNLGEKKWNINSVPNFEIVIPLDECLSSS